MEYLYHGSPFIVPFIVVKFHFFPFHYLFPNSSIKKPTTAGISGTGTTFLSGTHEFMPVFIGVRVANSSVFCALLCCADHCLFFYPFSFVIVLFVRLPFSTSDCPFGSFKRSLLALVIHGTTPSTETKKKKQ